MLIDCDSCAMQHSRACDDCVVTVLFGLTEGPIELAEAETTALGNLAAEGLVPPLRLVSRREPPASATG